MSALKGVFLLCLETYVHLQKHRDDPFTMPHTLTFPHQGKVESHCTWMLLVAFTS